MLRLKVKDIAERKGFSMGRLARAAHLDMNTMWRLYRGEHYIPTLITLAKLARALDVKLDDLVEDVGDE